MIERLIELSVRNRVFVAIVAVMLAVGGVWAIRATPLDALPDLSDVQVIVMTEFPGQAPNVVEDQVTYPLSSALLAVPHARVVRGYSMFGLSMVYVLFEDGTDLYWARSRVLEYLNVAAAGLPQGAMPMLGPDATGIGWVYQYVLTDFSPRARVLRAHLDADGSGTVEAHELPAPADGGRFSEAQLRRLFDPTLAQVRRVPLSSGGEALVHDPPLPGADAPDAFVADALRFVIDGFDRDGDRRIGPEELLRAANFAGMDLQQLRSLQDWFLRYELMALPGVSEVASVGGFVRQYQVEVDPEKLRAFGVTLPQVTRAIEAANLDVGGRVIEMAETEFMVRGRGYISSVDDLMTVPVAVDSSTHTPVLLRQVAHVQVGPETRRGIVELNGEGEVVGGIVLLRQGGDAPSVIGAVERRLAELKPGLPEGVEIHVAYDRSSLIARAIASLWETLGKEMLVVALICVVFLLHLRSSLVAVITLPLGVLAAFLAMRALGLNANIMSLGGIAIAIGVMVDASIVMVENLHKHKERSPDEDHETLVIRAAREVGPALFFSLLVVTISFVPVFSLEQQEGRLFIPLAWTKTLAMLAASGLAVTLIPALMFWLIRGRLRPESANPVSRLTMAIYRPLLAAVLRRPLLWLFGAVAFAAFTLLPASRLGSEFMPPLDEGDLLYMPTTPPGLSVTKAREILQQTDRLIASHPQVERVLGKIGRAETATDPAPLTMIETTILLRPRAEWPKGKTQRDIIRELDAMVQLPGVTNAWTMPIKTRIDMLATGIKTPVGIKLLGNDLEELSAIGQRIEAVLRDLPGVSSVYSERVTDGNYVDIDIRREDAARYGLNIADVQQVIASAIGGRNVTWTVEGLERYPVNVRFPRELRDDLYALGQIAVPTPMGHTVPLAHVADIGLAKGPPMIKSENARRTAWIYVDLNTSDLGGFVRSARELVDREVPMPAGVSLQWSGQYEYMARAAERLALVVPMTLGLIFVLLYLHFQRVAESLMVMVATLVFAPIGGVWMMWAYGFNLSVAAAIGFIALLGLAAETGVLMVVYMDEAFDRYAREGRMRHASDLRAAITEGAVDRLRPKLMTVATDFLALLPILVGTGTGVELMKRVAAPMVGGVLTSAVLTLLLLPALYYLWKHRALGHVAPEAD